MFLKLLNTHTLTFTRKGTGGYYDDDGNWVEATPSGDPLEVNGGLQPFRQGETTVDLPQGVTAKDVRIFYTKTLLNIQDEYLDQEADTTVVDGAPYKVWHVETWQAGLPADHYKTFLVREDKMDVN